MKKIFALTALSTVLAANALATPFDMKFVRVDQGQGVSLTFDSNVMSVFAGKLQFQNQSNGNKFLTVCADLTRPISPGQSYNVDPQFSALSTPAVKRAGNIVAANFFGANTNFKAAALQVAVWEALYDGGSSPSFTGGRFCLNGASQNLTSQATEYYQAICNTGNALHYKTTTNCGQSQLAPVPEPAALTALVAGVGLMVARRKKS